METHQLAGALIQSVILSCLKRNVDRNIILVFFSNSHFESFFTPCYKILVWCNSKKKKNDTNPLCTKLKFLHLALEASLILLQIIFPNNIWLLARTVISWMPKISSLALFLLCALLRTSTPTLLSDKSPTIFFKVIKNCVFH